MTTAEEKANSLSIKEKAYELGFNLCGIAPSRTLQEHENKLRDWCSSGMNGEMHYLNRNIEKRINPALLFEGAKSVIVTGLNYYTPAKQGGGGIPVISRYAYGDDYHIVVKEKLNKLIDYMKIILPGAEGKSFVDSSPVLEKAWAREAGIGWPGRHTILINKDIGSFFFLGIIIINIELFYDKPFTVDHCTDCRLCIDSCPTGAIGEERTIDARKCISYLTVEQKEPVPESVVGKIEGRVFGCDRCQDVCPWNKRATMHTTPEFNLIKQVEHLSSNDWLNLSSDQYKSLFNRSSIARKRYDVFMKNVTNVTKS